MRRVAQPLEEVSRKKRRLSMALQNGVSNNVIARPARTDACNGSSGPASTSPASQHQSVGLRYRIDRAEYVRLLQQALQQLGYTEAARTLQEESGIGLEVDEVSQLRGAVTEGVWDEAVALLERLNLPDEDSRKQAKFLVLQQKYLEALEAKEVGLAVECLRREVTPVGASARALQDLAGCMLCRTPQELRAYSAWPGTGPASRQRVLTSLQGVMAPAVMLPERRLEALLEQALDSQLRACLYHNSHQASVSLLQDYSCGKEQLPTTTVQILLDHSDEVWHIQFSPDGRMLASASKDCTAIVWDVRGRRVARRHVLRGHTQSVAYLAWSPNGTMLATCGNDQLLKLWDAASGDCLRTMSHHTSAVTSVAWLPSSQQLVTGSHDKSMVLVNLDGKEVQRWKGLRINDLQVSCDGRYLLRTPASEHRVRVLDLALQHDLGEDDLITEEDSIVSMCLSADSQHLLLHLANQKIHLWEFPTDPDVELPTTYIQEFKGTSEGKGRFVVRSCFGGFDQSFILSGSEDCKVYIWHRSTGELLAQLEGHSGTVNSVAWNPADSCMFASASDDRSIHIWGPASAAHENGSMV